MPNFGQNTPAKLEKIKEQRRIAYATEADPLFFKWKRGEVTEEDYLAAVEQVKLKYPYPEG